MVGLVVERLVYSFLLYLFLWQQLTTSLPEMKMKRLITSALLALLMPVAAYAYDFEVDGIYYNYRNDAGTVEVTESPSSNRYAGDVTIPETVTYKGSTYTVKVISDWAFTGCNGLTSVAIGDSVSMIGFEAFAHCDNLTSVSIGSAVTYIGNNAFSSSRNLSHLIVASDNRKYDSRDDCNAVIMTATSVLVAGCRNTVIPGSVTGIWTSAFAGCSELTSVDIPGSVTVIAMEAFSGCSGLTSLTIPASVTKIGLGAFNGCANLQSIIVENGNTAYDSHDNCNAIIETASNTLIAGCQNTVIPISVTSIGDFAFAGMSGLTSITIPESVTAIGENAFQDCSGLTSVTIPSSVSSIGNYAFTIGEGMFLMCSGLTSVRIPGSVTSIGNFAFVECGGLTSVTIPGSVTAIGTRAFWNCSGLTDVYSHITDLSRMTYGSGAFYLSDKNYSGRTLHVPQGAADVYQTDEKWYPYFGRIVDDVMPEEYLRGDVNLDGDVDISDLNTLVNIILGGGIYTARADVNSDGEITIADINVIIDVIVSGHEEPEHEYVDLGPDVPL